MKKILSLWLSLSLSLSPSAASLRLLHLLLFFSVSFLLLVLSFKKNRRWDERERPWDTERKSKISEREREIGSLRDWTWEREIQMEREIAGPRKPRWADRRWVATGEPRWGDFRQSRGWFPVGLSVDRPMGGTEFNNCETGMWMILGDDDFYSGFCHWLTFLLAISWRRRESKIEKKWEKKRNGLKIKVRKRKNNKIR